MSLWELRQMYFTRRSGVGRQFDFKLYNALCITSKFPDAVWISPNVTKIHAQPFAKMLGIHTVQGGLFHKQGNFSRYGFSHIFKHVTPEFALSPSCEDVDDYNVRLYTDKSNRFFREREFAPQEEF
jgi:hypothetical protein